MMIDAMVHEVRKSGHWAVNLAGAKILKGPDRLDSILELTKEQELLARYSRTDKTASGCFPEAIQFQEMLGRCGGDRIQQMYGNKGVLRSTLAF